MRCGRPPRAIGSTHNTTSHRPVNAPWSRHPPPRPRVWLRGLLGARIQPRVHTVSQGRIHPRGVRGLHHGHASRRHRFGQVVRMRHHDARKRQEIVIPRQDRPPLLHGDGIRARIPPGDDIRDLGQHLGPWRHPETPLQAAVRIQRHIRVSGEEDGPLARDAVQRRVPPSLADHQRVHADGDAATDGLFRKILHADLERIAAEPPSEALVREQEPRIGISPGVEQEPGPGTAATRRPARVRACTKV